MHIKATTGPTHNPCSSKPRAVGSRGHRPGLGGWPGPRGASCQAKSWPLRATLHPAAGHFCSPFALSLGLGLHRDTSPLPASSLKTLLFLFHFPLSFQWRFITLSDYAVSQMRGEYPFFLHSSYRSLWLSAKRAEIILVPFSCRYYLFAGWQHVGKPIKNQNPRAWSWVIIHLFKTWKELGGQLSACKASRQTLPIRTEDQSHVAWEATENRQRGLWGDRNIGAEDSSSFHPSLGKQEFYTRLQSPRRWSMHGHTKRFSPRPIRSIFIFEDWFFCRGEGGRGVCF